jgi:ABC-2 type transport system permease protein
VVALRQIARLTIDGLRTHCRDGQLVFWNYVFFLVLLVLFVTTLGRDPSVRVIMVSGIVTIAIMGTAMFSVGIGMSAARDRGIYRRLSMFPVPPSRFLWAAVIWRWFVAFSSAAILIVVARVFFGVTWPGGMAVWILGIAVGAAAFGAIGFALAGLAPTSHRANAYVNAVFVPMLVLGGASVPVGMLPHWVVPASSVLPSTALVNVLQGAIIRGDGVSATLGAFGTMLAWAIGASVIGAIAWRRRGLL